MRFTMREPLAQTMTNCLHLRNFTRLNETELLMLLERRNHPEVRKWMTNSELITPAEHLRFCVHLQEQPDTLMLLAEFNEKPTGVISFHARDNSWQEVVDFGCYAFYPQVYFMINIEQVTMLHLVAQRGIKHCSCKVKSANRLGLLLVEQVLGAHPVKHDADYAYFELNFPETPAHYQTQLKQRLNDLKLQLDIAL